MSRPRPGSTRRAAARASRYLRKRDVNNLVIVAAVGREEWVSTWASVRKIPRDQAIVLIRAARFELESYMREMDVEEEHLGIVLLEREGY